MKLRRKWCAGRAACSLVCTPEVPSLQMALQRIAELEGVHGVPGDRVHIVLNRHQERRKDCLPGRSKRCSGAVRFFATLPNDYAHVQKFAVIESRLVASR